MLNSIAHYGVCKSYFRCVNSSAGGFQTELEHEMYLPQIQWYGHTTGGETERGKREREGERDDCLLSFFDKKKTTFYAFLSFVII